MQIKTVLGCPINGFTDFPVALLIYDKCDFSKEFRHNSFILFRDVSEEKLLIYVWGSNRIMKICWYKSSCAKKFSLSKFKLCFLSILGAE